MKPFFSIKLWCIFFFRLIKVIYPADLVLIIFALPEFKRLKESRTMRFLLIFLVCNVGVRLVPFFACVPFTQRYFYPCAINIAILAAYGIVNLVEFLDTKIIKKKIKITQFHLYSLLIIIIGIAYSAKALNPRNDKPWLQVIPAVITKIIPSEKVPIIISNDLDNRWGYYADTEELYQLDPEQDWLLMKPIRVGFEYRWVEFDQQRGISNLAEKINAMGKDRVFLILRVDKNGESPSNSSLLKQYPEIYLKGTFKDRKKRVFKLYSFVK